MLVFRYELVGNGRKGVVIPSIAAHPSTAFRLRESTKSNGGAAGDDALCKACRDCRHTVKQVQEPPAELDGVDFDLDGACR